jgi:hypothetical protein
MHFVIFVVLDASIGIYVYIYMCVCMCVRAHVCVCLCVCACVRKRFTVISLIVIYLNVVKFLHNIVKMFPALQMGAKLSSEVLVTTYKPTHGHHVESYGRYFRPFENIRFQTFNCISLRKCTSH